MTVCGVQAFLEGLLEAYCTEVGATKNSDRALLLSAAAVELLRGHALLADHAVALGYTDRLLKLLAARLPMKPSGQLAGPTAMADMHMAQVPVLRCCCAAFASVSVFLLAGQAVRIASC